MPSSGSSFCIRGRSGGGSGKREEQGGQRNPALIRRHRRGGPVFALMGMAGYLAGAVLVFIDKGHLVEFPLHLMTGSGIVLLITTAFILSRKIKGSASPWRTPHFIVGLFILLLYLLQTYIGLNILL
jgi:Protein of unknown function (DUF4079)